MRTEGHEKEKYVIEQRRTDARNKRRRKTSFLRTPFKI
jgi:hypothetical protein